MFDASRSQQLPTGTADPFFPVAVVHMSNARVVVIEVQRLEEGYYLATSPDIPGMVEVEGDTIETFIPEIFSVAVTMQQMTETDALRQGTV